MRKVLLLLAALVVVGSTVSAAATKAEIYAAGRPSQGMPDSFELSPGSTGVLLDVLTNDRLASIYDTPRIAFSDPRPVRGVRVGVDRFDRFLVVSVSDDVPLGEVALSYQVTFHESGRTQTVPVKLIVSDDPKPVTAPDDYSSTVLMRPHTTHVFKPISNDPGRDGRALSVHSCTQTYHPRAVNQMPGHRPTILDGGRVSVHSLGRPLGKRSYELLNDISTESFTKDFFCTISDGQELSSLTKVTYKVTGYEPVRAYAPTPKRQFTVVNPNPEPTFFSFREYNQWKPEVGWTKLRRIKSNGRTIIKTRFAYNDWRVYFRSNNETHLALTGGIYLRVNDE